MTAILFRCDAGKSPEIGTGHVSRCIHLATLLVKKNYFSKKEISFLTKNSKGFEFGKKYLNSYDFKLFCINSQKIENNSLFEAKEIIKINPKLVIIDRLRTTKDFILRIKNHGIKVVSFDDYGYGRNFTNLSINAIFDNIKDAKNITKGLEYLILKKSLKKKYIRKKVRYIVATFGGFDFRNLSKFFIENISYISNDIRIYIILGEVSERQIKQYRRLKEKSKNFWNIEILIKPDNFRELISMADIGVSSGGITIYDFANSRVPTISIPQYSHQLNTIKKLHKMGVSMLGSKSMKLNHKYFENTMQKLINGYDLRKKMTHAATKNFDDKGSHRVLMKLSKLI
tara:strand:+ start:2821 stop:3846 length:1026 start_codon:yes stop_codon:yes gene_type:complete